MTQNPFETALRRVGLAVASGLLLALAQPLAFGNFDALARGPNGLLAFVALVPWLFSIRDAPASQAAALTAVTTFTSYVGTIHWVFVAMHTYGGLDVFTSVFGLFMLCMALAVMMAPAGAVIVAARKRLGLPMWALAPVVWTAVEFGRTWIFTGFPWSNLAYSQWALPTAQMADLFGLHGINLLLVAVNVVAAEWIWTRIDPEAPRPIRPTLVVAALVVAATVYGLIRPHTLNGASTEPMRIAMAQGNIPQDEKHDREFREQIVRIYNRLTAQAVRRGAELVVWPEGALPYTVHRETRSMSPSAILRKYDATLLIGAPSYWHEEGVPYLHNSAFLVDPDHKVLGRYDKSHLVPFGEYVPIPIPGFATKLVEGVGDFVPGEPHTLKLNGDEIGVLICYEDIFPEISRKMVRDGATILVNITNDAWYGRTSAPHQHLVMNAFRAIETRRPVVRAANTGISGVVDRTGKIRVASPLFEEVLLVEDVKPARGQTLYTLTGDVLGWVAFAAMLGLAAVSGWTYYRSRASGGT